MDRTDEITQSKDGEHYSTRVYRDEAVARQFDGLRFGGAVGDYFKTHQESVIRRFLPNVTGLKILDLGAGTGRTSIPLTRRGAQVVAADASMEMLQVAREKSWLQGARFPCVRSDAHALAFPDNTFDAVLSFRMLMHVVDWRQTLFEICRISRRWVMVDFPPLAGFAGLAPLVHPVIRCVKRNHQSYRIFKLSEVVDALRRFGFEPVAVDRHVVLPFGFHRLMGSVTFTRRVEDLLRRMGLQDMFGAPVTILAERKNGYEDTHDRT